MQYMYHSETHAALLFLTSVCFCMYIPTHSTYRKAASRDCTSSIRKRFTTTKDILSTLFSFHIFLLKKYILDRNISTGELPFSCVIIENNITFVHKTTKRFSRVNLNHYPFIRNEHFEYFSFSPPRISTKIGLHHSGRFSR